MTEFSAVEPRTPQARQNTSLRCRLQRPRNALVMWRILATLGLSLVCFAAGLSPGERTWLRGGRRDKMHEKAEPGSKRCCDPARPGSDRK